VSADGSVGSLRNLLNDLHAARIDVDGLTIHTPDLDDVFFAVTGTRVSGPSDEPALVQSAPPP
jgi:ABC-2 type transport system ATP-binding protein